MRQKISLQGIWDFCMDETKQGIEQEYFKRQYDDTIALPGTTAQQKKGNRGSEQATDHLTEQYHFEGYAWYSRQISLDKQTGMERYVLNLERTRISYVWVDDRFVGSRDSFCTAHQYELTEYLHNNSHRLTVMVSNTDYKTPGGHMTSPDTQTNWNGILGDISLNIYDAVRIEDVQIYPDAEKCVITADITVSDWEKMKDEADITLALTYKGEPAEHALIHMHTKDNHCRMTIPESVEVKLWNEYTPVLYDLHVIVEMENSQDKRCVTFGFRNLHTTEQMFYLNDLPIMLRGKHDGMVYPITGYAPMEVDEWRKTFDTAKSYGINHYRFHTCCPPEAAFAAADELGIYLEPEIPFWGTVEEKGEPEYDGDRQEYLVEEGYRILKKYGNHPSFLMFSLGNELWGSTRMVNEMLGDYKKSDPRHWYTQGSNGFQFMPVIMEHDDFYCGVRFSKNRLFRGSYAMCDAPQGHVQLTEPEYAYNYDEQIRPVKLDQSSGDAGEIQIQYQTGVKVVKAEQTEELIPHVPVVSHEVGQYQFYPNFDEITKYTGVLQPENFKIFRERLVEKGMEKQAKRFFDSAGRLAADCYKREIETAMRSRELAGFQLLDLQDFSGQGTALVGILDAFMDNKGIISRKDWREFCSDQVVMLRLPKLVYHTGERIPCEILLCNMLPEQYEELTTIVTLTDMASGNQWSRKKTSHNIDISRLAELGTEQLQIPDSEEPHRYRVQIQAEELEITNHYEIIAYPEVLSEKSLTDLLVTDNREQMLEALRQGEAVIFFGDGIESSHSLEADYCSDFWCYPMFASISENMNRPKPVGTLGLSIAKEHPVFAEFPTEEYTTAQWWQLLKGSRVAILDDTRVEPMAWMVDNFARNHRLGFIYEARVGEGRLLVCQANLEKNNSRQSKWLLKSMKDYASSDHFTPTIELNEQILKEMYH